MRIITFILLCFILNISAIENDNEIEAKKIPYQIKYFTMKNCYKNSEALSFQNVQLITRNYNIVASGIMIANIDLITPIQVSVYLERKILGVWIPMPCVNNLGSCTYHDACEFGTSVNETCPENFQDSHFPCRCPINQGTYKLTNGLKIPKQTFMKSWTSGEYYGQVTVKKDSKEIGCYKVSFSLID